MTMILVGNVDLAQEYDQVYRYYLEGKKFIKQIMTIPSK